MYLSESDNDIESREQKDEDALSVDEGDITYGVTDSESSSESDGEFQNSKNAVDFADEEEDEDDSGSTDIQAWGQRVGNYYGGVEEQDVEAFEEEAEEARKLQQEQLKHLNFETDEISAFLDEEEEDEEEVDKSKSQDGQMELTTIEKDISSYSDEDKIKILEKDAPEIFGLIDDVVTGKAKIAEIKEAIKKCSDKDLPSVKLLQRFGLLMVNYITTVTFYLLLKSRGELHENHPVFDKIIKLKTMIVKHSDQIDSSIKSVGEERKTRKRRRKKQPASVFGPKRRPADLPEEEEVEEEPKKLNAWEMDKRKGDHRSIGRKIMKNVGLKRYRKKDRKTPRSSMRYKYEKKVKIRKKQFRQWKPEPNIYSGEKNINPLLVRALSFKGKKGKKM